MSRKSSDEGHSSFDDDANAADVRGLLWWRRGVATASVLILLITGASGLSVEPSEATWLGAGGLVGLLLFSIAAAVSAFVLPKWLARRRKKQVSQRVRRLSDSVAFAAAAAVAAIVSPVVAVPAALVAATTALLERSPAVRRDIAVQLGALDPRLARLSAWIRVIGPALIGVWFLAFWTFVFMLTWALDTQAYDGISPPAAFGDFVYLAVNGAVGNVPPEFHPQSNLAHMLTSAEFLSAAVLLGTYLTISRLGGGTDHATSGVSLQTASTPTPERQTAGDGGQSEDLP